MADYAIGDIQGCYKELRLLLKAINFNSQTDTLWIAGDLVNRGPQSLEVLKFLFDIQNSVNVVLGNHDLHLLAIAAGTRKHGPKDTLTDILESPECDQLISWLRQQALLIHNPEKHFTMVHAGIPPIWSIDEARAYAKEVENCIKSNNWIAFTQNMYSDTPKCWSNALEGNTRLRVITNYLTRMRFCTQYGELDLKDKESRFSKRQNFKPWFEYKNLNITDNEHIIFGHWAALEGHTGLAHYHALDTGCIWGGTLTAMNITNKQCTQVKSQGH